MEIHSCYSVKIKQQNNVFKDSVALYRGAVDFFIDVCLNHWDEISTIADSKQRQRYVETLTVRTKRNKDAEYDFCGTFYKFPCYLRRGAISEAIGKVSSYKSNLKNWEALTPSERKNSPSPPKAGFVYPCLYRGNMYVRTDTYSAQIKVFIRNTWDWINVDLKKSDVDYILRHCADRDQSCPTLQKRGKEWFLDFAFTEKVSLSETPVYGRRILAVDLGITSACVCSVMRADGTILGRHFLRLSRENDCLWHKVSHIKRAQHKGARKTKNLWAYAKGINKQIASRTAQFITDIAVLYQVDVVVFEHLDLNGKKRGSKKQRLHLWKARDVQAIVADKVHRLGMRVSHICARNTSKLAFDGSGETKRGSESDKTKGKYNLCEFANGKVYNCDLNASYNIGARYFIRELEKTIPVTEWQRIVAKVPECAKRSTCTLSSLISLYTELCACA